MFDSRNTRVLGVLAMALVVTLAGFATFATAGAAQSSGITVTLEPVDETVDAGEQTTYEVVVNGATDGINGYEMSIALGNATVATFDDWSDEHDPSFPNTEVSPDQINISAAMGNGIAGADEIVLGTFNVTGETAGDTALEFVDGASGVEVTDGNDDPYTVDSATDGSLTVQGEIEDPALSLSPSSVTLAPGNDTGMEFQAQDITRGVSSFEVTIGVENDQTVTLDEVNVQGDSNPSVTQNDDGGVTIQAQPNRGNGDLTLASFSVEGNELGSTDLVIEEVTVRNETSEAYTPRALNNASATVESESGSASIKVRPSQEEVPAGSETTLDVVVLDAGNGISGYAINVTVNDTSVGEFTAFDHANEPFLDQSQITDGNSTVALSTALGDSTFGPAAQTVVATLTLNTSDIGAVEVSMESGAGVSDTDDNQYEIKDLKGTVVETKEGPPPVVNNPPKDPDGDGLYENVNGDETVNIFDVVALFNNLDSDAVQDNAASFNFNEDPDDVVNIFDVTALFNELDKFQ